MAGIAGNRGHVAFAKQTPANVKGTPATAATYKVALTGGGIRPSRSIARLAETDSSRDQGLAYAQRGGAEGDPEAYVRDPDFGMIVFANFGIGSDAVTGTTPNFVHTLTPATALPYMTFWRSVGGGVIAEQYQDMLVSSINVKADAGNPLTVAMGLVGRQSLFQPTDPNSAVNISNGPTYNFNNATVTLAGGATGAVSSFDFTLDNNVSAQQTDDFFAYDVTPGQRQATLGFDMLFETADEYRKFHYATVAGTAQSSTIYTTAMHFTFAGVDANHQIDFDFPVVAYQEYPVDVNTGGDPIVVPVRTSIEKNTPLVSVVIKNSVASY